MTPCTRSLLIILTLSVAPTSVLGDEIGRGEEARVATYLEGLEAIRSDLEQREPRPLSAREWELWHAAAADMQGLLQGKSSLEQLDAGEREALRKVRSRLEALLTGAEDERLVCRRERRTGSHLARTSCVTVSQRRAEIEAAHEVMRRLPTLPGAQDRGYVSPAGGGR